MKKYIVLLFIFFNTVLVFSAPDWSTGVAPIVYSKCASCHHTNGAGHANFIKYDSAVYYAGAIQYYVTNKKMPPWPPNTNYRIYAHQRTLSQAEINTINDWVNGGMLLGDTTLAPPKPVYNGSAILTAPPDLTFTMPTYTVASAVGGDIYRNFVIPTYLTSNKYIKGFEFIPGDPSIVHHSLIFADTGTAAIALDAADPAPGYNGFGGAGTNTARLLGAFVPGSVPFLFPTGFGMSLPQNSVLIFNMHYPAAAVGKMDSSRINIYYANGTVREVYFLPVLHHNNPVLQNPPLAIAANTTKTFWEKYQAPLDVSVFGVAPHMHLIGTRIKSFSVTPTNDTIPLIDIPQWDFKWQGTYYFQKIQKIVANSNLYATAFYDNTSSNINNPNSPPQLVVKGENTTDEMMLVFFAYSYYLPGDENVIIDSTLLSTNVNQFIENEKYFKLFPCYPNPVSSHLNLKYYTYIPCTVTYSVHSLTGVKIFTHTKRIQKSGYFVETIPLEGLSAGEYVIEMCVNNEKQTQRFIKK